MKYRKTAEVEATEWFKMGDSFGQVFRITGQHLL